MLWIQEKGGGSKNESSKLTKWVKIKYRLLRLVVKFKIYPRVNSSKEKARKKTLYGEHICKSIICIEQKPNMIMMSKFNSILNNTEYLKFYFYFPIFWNVFLFAQLFRSILSIKFMRCLALFLFQKFLFCSLALIFFMSFHPRWSSFVKIYSCSDCLIDFLSQRMIFSRI